MAAQYAEKGHGELGQGLWAFLLTPSPDDTRQFFELYAEHLNRTMDVAWHCVGFVDRVATEPNWRASRKLHELSNALRGVIGGEILGERDAALVFFNPFEDDVTAGEGVV